MEATTSYVKKYYPENQKELTDGIIINPALRPGFDCTPNQDRDPKEVLHWWGLAYIVTCGWDEMTESWEQYSERMNKFENHSSSETRNREQFEADKEKQKEEWFKAWGDDGLRYEVHCLDGGAWDRPSEKLMTGSLNEALNMAKTINEEQGPNKTAF